MTHLFLFSFLVIDVRQNEIYPPHAISEVHGVLTLLLLIHLHTHEHLFAQSQAFMRITEAS